ncbi:MAG: hypothetical protein INR71_12120, partial [Terriglobus roseus]|nr:hypothetical protein [Terriglobus roseus]
VSHYYQEIRPLVKSLAGFKGIDQMMMEQDKELVKLHMIDPATIPNYVMGMQDTLPDTVPDSMFKQERLKLMDAGMSNNLPIYPLLRSGRDVDIIISFDVSADARQANWLHVVEGYARQRGIKGWPIGAGWPPADAPDDEVVDQLDQSQNGKKKETERKVDDATKAQAKVEAQGKGVGGKNTKDREDKKPAADLTYCNVWIGSTTEHTTSGDEPPRSKRIFDEKDGTMTAATDATDTDEDSADDNEAGICVIYFPLLANPSAPEADPQSSPFMSTWNFVYTPSQIDAVVALARANFDAGAGQTRRAVRAVWERKRRTRLAREATEAEQLKALRKEKKRMQLRSGRGMGKKPGEGDHGDHFS